MTLLLNPRSIVVQLTNLTNRNKTHVMMKKRHTLCALIFLAFLCTGLRQEVRACYFMGGEITWECTPQGNFRFIVKLYRTCAASASPNSLQLTTNVPEHLAIPIHRTVSSDISPVCSCPGGVNTTCATTSYGNVMSGAVEEIVYTSDQTFPNGVPLTGVPPSSGWYFAVNPCCRNSSSNIVNSATSSGFIRAYMYPYQGTPVNTCFDNSPRFLEGPSTVICTGYPFAYNYMAADPELDSLVYSWAQPLSSNNTPLTNYFTGYSWDSPLPGPSQNPSNVAANLDPHTGEVTLTSHTNGAFITATKITAYKAGVKVAEVFRDMSLLLRDCGLNDAPFVTPPFQDSLGQYTLFQDTVYAGQLVNFPLSANNLHYCPNTTPPVPQTFSLDAFGPQFGAPINPAGCPNPPCATLNPSPTWQNPLTGTFGVQTTFNWQTGCQHLATVVGCGTTSNTYNFLFKVMDNFCPVPGIRYATVTVVVLGMPPPQIRFLDVLPTDEVLLTWSPVLVADPAGYIVTVSQGGVPIHYDTIHNPLDTTWHDLIHNPCDGILSYQVTAFDACGNVSAPSQTLETILPVVLHDQNQLANHITWNPYSGLVPGPGSGYELWYSVNGAPAALLTTVPAQVTQYTHANITAGDTICYTVRAFDNAQQLWSNSCEVCAEVPTSIAAAEPLLFTVGQNIPNPATGQTLIPFAVPEAGRVKLTIANLSGQTVWQKEMQANPGKNHFTINAATLSKGVYLYTVHYKGATQTRRLIVND